MRYREPYTVWRGSLYFGYGIASFLAMTDNKKAAKLIACGFVFINGRWSIVYGRQLLSRQSFYLPTCSAKFLHTLHHLLHFLKLL